MSRPKHAVHNERSGTPLTTRVSVANITNDCEVGMTVV